MFVTKRVDYALTISLYRKGPRQAHALIDKMSMVDFHNLLDCYYLVASRKFCM